MSVSGPYDTILQGYLHKQVRIQSSMKLFLCCICCVGSGGSSVSLS